MKCPVCPETNLVMTERQGVEIDYCPNCRGVWLDRGELDKIIERSAAQESSPAQPVQQQQAPPQYQQQPQYGHYDKHHGHGYGHGHNYKKRKSFLEELFD
jgi:uncharacterized protein